MKERLTVDISIQTILKLIGVILGIWLLYFIRDILVMLFIVIILVMALAPVVDKWQRIMPRALAVGLLFIILAVVLSVIVSLLIPPLVSQVGELANNLPLYTDRFESILSSLGNPTFQDSITGRALQGLSQQLSRVSQGLLQLSLGVLGGFVTFFTVMILSAYMLFEERGIRKFFISLLPLERKEKVIGALDKVGDKLGGWLRGQLFLMIIIGLVTGIWTSLLGLPYALTLGLWAGLTEVIPFIGPIIGGIPILLIAFIDSPLKAVIAIVLLALTQQVESNFIVPKVMQRSVGLSPVVVILALLIGGKLFGITGTILAVPLAATLSVILQEWPRVVKAVNPKTQQV